MDLWGAGNSFLNDLTAVAESVGDLASSPTATFGSLGSLSPSSVAEPAAATRTAKVEEAKKKAMALKAQKLAKAENLSRGLGSADSASEVGDPRASVAGRSVASRTVTPVTQDPTAAAKAAPPTSPFLAPQPGVAPGQPAGLSAPATAKARRWPTPPAASRGGPAAAQAGGVPAKRVRKVGLGDHPPVAGPQRR